jgi:DNA-binding XRE family transcriptional regulator
MTFVEKLKQIQETAGYSDKVMAQMIGCSRQQYQATRSGRIPLGLTILKGGVRVFPELIPDAIYFLTDGAHIETQIVINLAHQETIEKLRRPLGKAGSSFISSFK